MTNQSIRLFSHPRFVQQEPLFRTGAAVCAVSYSRGLFFVPNRCCARIAHPYTGAGRRLFYFRQGEEELQAAGLAYAGGDGAVVQQDGVLDYGEAETRTAEFA